MKRKYPHHLITRAKDAAWLASYRLGEPWDSRVRTVKMAQKAPFRALTCYEAIIRSYR